VSELDATGSLLRSFTDVKTPYHLSLDGDGRVLVADRDDNRILLLSRELQLQRDCLVESRLPARLHYDERTSQLYVMHSSGCRQSSDVVSVFCLRLADATPHQC